GASDTNWILLPPELSTLNVRTCAEAPAAKTKGATSRARENSLFKPRMKHSSNKSRLAAGRNESSAHRRGSTLRWGPPFKLESGVPITRAASQVSDHFRRSH